MLHFINGGFNMVKKVVQFVGFWELWGVLENPPKALRNQQIGPLFYENMWIWCPFGQAKLHTNFKTNVKICVFYILKSMRLNLEKR